MSKPETWDRHYGCIGCRYEQLPTTEEPCNSCYGDIDNWEPVGTVATADTSETVVQTATTDTSEQTATDDDELSQIRRETDTIATIKDSGTRREFDTGAVRDIQTGKGRCDLMPLAVVADILGNGVLSEPVLSPIFMYQLQGDTMYLKCAITAFCDKRQWTLPCAMLEVSKHFEDGALKYGEHNWEKGLPESCYIDSAVRHYLKWLDGWTDEPHDRAVLWNLMCLWWTHENITEMKWEGDV